MSEPELVAAAGWAAPTVPVHDESELTACRCSTCRLIVDVMSERMTDLAAEIDPHVRWVP